VKIAAGRLPLSKKDFPMNINRNRPIGTLANVARNANQEERRIIFP